MTEQREERRVSRRTIAKGAAWTIPAVPIVLAAPAYAASGSAPSITPGKAYKWPGNSCTNTPNVPVFQDGNKAYLFTFRVVNNSDKTIYIYDADVTTTSTITFDVIGATPAFGTPIAPGGSMDLRLWANSNSSANLTFDAKATIYWGHNFPGPDPDDHDPVVKEWHVSGTPTTTSEGYRQCAIPPYVACGGVGQPVC